MLSHRGKQLIKSTLGVQPFGDSHGVETQKVHLRTYGLCG